MKKLLMVLFVLGIISFGFQTHASTLSDAMLKIKNLQKEISQLKIKLKGSAWDPIIGTSTTDLTPRISYYPGKVNQHVDVASGMWVTDIDGSSGSGIDKLTYCKKWYPSTVGISDYKIETINTWQDAGNVNNYTSSRISTQCITTAPVAVCSISNFNVSPNVITSGDPVTISWSTNNCTSLNIASVGPVSSATGTKIVYPTYTTGYALIAMSMDNKSAVTSDSKTVVVNPKIVTSPTIIPTTTPTISGTCLNGATNYPTCNITPVISTCLNGATNYPSCTTKNNVCLNGSINPPTCNMSVTVGTCLNGATNYPTCTTSTTTPTTIAAKVTYTSDLTPRISVWQGKVNQHVSVSEGMWQTDPDGISGADIDKLTYCKKWYPNTTSVVEYKIETINAWHDRGNINDYPSTRMSYKCVDSTVLAPIPSIKVSLDSSTPINQKIIAGAGKVVFAKIKLSADSQSVNNLNAIQVASNLINSTKLNNIAIYDGNTKIGSTIYGLSYNGEYYQSWVYLDNKLSIPAYTSKVLSIIADTSPVGSMSYFNGDVRLGVAGWTFDYPGARVEPFGTPIYGSLFTVGSSAGDITTSSITILSPNGGEVYNPGQQVTVKWNSIGITGNIAEINLIPLDMRYGTGITIVKDIPNTGSYTLSIPTLSDLTSQYFSLGKNFKMEVVGFGSGINNVVSDKSNDLFTINPIISTPSVTVISPNGDTSYASGQEMSIKWKTKNIPYNPYTLVAIMDDRTPGWQTKSLFGSSPALNYARLVESNGSDYTYEYSFKIPSTFNDSLPSQYQNIYGGNHYKILVNVVSPISSVSSTQKVFEDYSDSNFTIISAPVPVYSVLVSYPNGGENFVIGKLNKISWTGGKTKVQIGLVYPNFTPEYSNTDAGSILGWIELNGVPNGNTTWDGVTLKDLGGEKIYFNPGVGNYKIIAVTASEIGNYCSASAANCSFDLSDNSFKIISAPKICPSIAMPSSDFCMNGTVRANSGEDGCVYSYSCIGKFMTIDDIYANKSMVSSYGNKLIETEGYIYAEDINSSFIQTNNDYINIRNKADMQNNKNMSLKIISSDLKKTLINKYNGVHGDWIKVEAEGTLKTISLPMNGTVGEGIYMDVSGLLIRDIPTVGQNTVDNNTPTTTNINQGTQNIRTLRLTFPRMSGDDVKMLQTSLGLKADGVFGRGTANAVRNWQINNGLKADGVFGRGSRNVMFNN